MAASNSDNVEPDVPDSNKTVEICTKHIVQALYAQHSVDTIALIPYVLKQIITPKTDDWGDQTGGTGGSQTVPWTSSTTQLYVDS